VCGGLSPPVGFSNPAHLTDRTGADDSRGTKAIARDGETQSVPVGELGSARAMASARTQRGHPGESKSNTRKRYKARASE